jgi:hypothetical protein
MTITAASRGAGVKASVRLDVVAVVASLVTGLPGFTVGAAHTITAASGGAIFATRVRFFFVSVITGFVIGIAYFKVGAANAVAANRRDAAVAARVRVHLVSVVADLIAVLTLLDVRTQKSVAAGRRSAVVGARIGVALVAIITLLAVVDLTVSAQAHYALIIAAIVGDIVPVITSLVAFLPFRAVQTANAITTARHDAGVSAAVRVAFIPIVASLDTGP